MIFYIVFIVQPDKKYKDASLCKKPLTDSINLLLLFYTNLKIAMPTKGEIFTDPSSGNVIEFIETSADTGGKYAEFKVTLKMQGPLVPNHYHLFQDEHFEVISGKLTYWLDGNTHVIGSGESILLPKNIPHNHCNNDAEPLVYIHKATPGLDFDYFKETLGGLGTDGKLNNGKPKLVQQLFFSRYLESKSLGAGIPVFLQKLLQGIICPIARLFGLKAIYQKYSGINNPS